MSHSKSDYYAYRTFYPYAKDLEKKKDPKRRVTVDISSESKKSPSVETKVLEHGLSIGQIRELQQAAIEADQAAQEFRQATEQMRSLDERLFQRHTFSDLFGTAATKVLEEPVDEEDALFLQRREEEMLVWYPRNYDHGEVGYQDNTMSQGSVPYFNLKDLLARFFITAHTQFGAIANWRDYCIGITSLYFNGSMCHMPMFDYDGKNVKTQIRKDAKLLQKEFGLGDAWVYETRRGFHVYFLCDAVSKQTYQKMLEVSGACKGFKRAFTNKGHSVLRISAKYTDFDIKFLYVLSSKTKELRRMPRKAHLILGLLGLGEQCGAHFASLYPQWAHYQEDHKEWKPLPRRRKGKRIRKAKIQEAPPKAEFAAKAKFYDPYRKTPKPMKKNKEPSHQELKKIYGSTYGYTTTTSQGTSATITYDVGKNNIIVSDNTSNDW